MYYNITWKGDADMDDKLKDQEVLGERWEDLKNRDPKNTSQEIKLLKKKIRYLKEKVQSYEDELAVLEGGYAVKERYTVREEGMDHLAELSNTVGDDHTRKF